MTDDMILSESITNGLLLQDVVAVPLEPTRTFT